jgi:RNase adaptor protein for sRNA GlmZ degradation
VMEGKTREWAKEVRTVRDVYVRVGCSGAEHRSVAVGRSASGRQDRSGAEGHDPDCSELLDPHIGRCE